MNQDAIWTKENVEVLVSKFLDGELSKQVSDLQIMEDAFVKVVYAIRDKTTIHNDNQVKISSIASGRVLVGGSLGFLVRAFPNKFGGESRETIIIEMQTNKPLAACLLFGNEKDIQQALFEGAFTPANLDIDPNWLMRLGQYYSLFEKPSPDASNINAWMKQLRTIFENELKSVITSLREEALRKYPNNVASILATFESFDLKDLDAEGIANSLQLIVQEIAAYPDLLRQANDDMRIIKTKYILPKDNSIFSRIPPWIYVLLACIFPFLFLLKGYYLSSLILFFFLLVGLSTVFVVWLITQNEKTKIRQDLRIIVLRWKSYMQEIGKS